MSVAAIDSAIAKRMRSPRAASTCASQSRGAQAAGADLARQDHRGRAGILHRLRGALAQRRRHAVRAVAEVHHLAHRLGEAHVRLLHARPVRLREVGAQRIHQPLRRCAGAAGRLVGRAQHGLGVPGVVDGRTGLDREGGGDVHVGPAAREGQQPVRRR